MKKMIMVSILSLSITSIAGTAWLVGGAQFFEGAGNQGTFLVLDEASSAQLAQGFSIGENKTEELKAIVTCTNGLCEIRLQK